MFATDPVKGMRDQSEFLDKIHVIVFTYDINDLGNKYHKELEREGQTTMTSWKVERRALFDMVLITSLLWTIVNVQRDFFSLLRQVLLHFVSSHNQGVTVRIHCSQAGCA